MPLRPRRTALSLAALAGLAMLASPALAQDRQQPDRRTPQADRRAQPSDRPMLSGPRVRDQRLPGVESGFSAGAEGGQRMGAQIVPPQVFREAISGLMAQDAPLEIRLSPEQRERIAAHVRAFEERGRGARTPQGRPHPGPGGRPTDGVNPGSDRPRAERPSDPNRPERPGQGPARSRAELDRAPQAPEPGPQRDAAPTGRRDMRQAVVAVQTRIWAELSAAQQAHVGGVIEAWRAKAAEQQMGQMRERYRREIGARFDEMQTDRPAPSDRRPEQDAEGRGGDTSELRQWFASLPDDVQRQVHERLLSMPAERRDALIQRATQMSAQERAQLVRRLLQAGQSPTERPKPQ